MHPPHTFNDGNRHADKLNRNVFLSGEHGPPANESNYLLCQPVRPLFFRHNELDAFHPRIYVFRLFDDVGDLHSSSSVALRLQQPARRSRQTNRRTDENKCSPLKNMRIDV